MHCTQTCQGTETIQNNLSSKESGIIKDEQGIRFTILNLSVPAAVTKVAQNENSARIEASPTDLTVGRVVNKLFPLAWLDTHSVKELKPLCTNIFFVDMNLCCRVFF